ncbi:hypothetical protein [Psychromicrobium sp. YIM B11713]|uniref:hypothetical protein n=1 Tax=Psychromicrobium sp. YIM B11713 TaxID=3145233 RepID=UPI00374F1A17
MIKVIGSALLGAGMAALLVSFLVPIWWLIAIGVAGLVLGFLLLILQGVARSVLGGFRGDPREFREVTSNGELAWAEVLTVSRTGLIINDSQHGFQLGLVVHPYGGFPFKTTARTLVSILEMARFQPGSRIVVRISAKYQGVVAVEKNPPADFTRNAPRVGASSYAGMPEYSGEIPKTKARVGVGLQLVAFIVAVAAVVVPFREPVLSFFQGNADRFAGVNALTEEHGQLIIQELEKATGGSQFTSIVFYPGRVRAEAPTAPGSTKIDEFGYNAGGATREGPASIQPQDFSEEVFDVAKLSFANLQSYIDKAPELTKVTGGQVSHVQLSRILGKPAQFNIYVSGDYGDGVVTVSSTGVGLSVNTEDHQEVILHSLLDPANLPTALNGLKAALKNQQITQLTVTDQTLEAQVDAGDGAKGTGIWSYQEGGATFNKQGSIGGIGSAAERSFPLPQLNPKQVQAGFALLKGKDSRRLTITRQVSLSISGGAEWKGGELVFTYSSQLGEEPAQLVATNAQGVRRR